MHQRDRPWDLEMVILAVITAVVLTAVMAPIVMVVVISFTSGQTLQFPPPGWSLRWYRSALELASGGGLIGGSGRLQESLLDSLAIASAVTAISLGCGVLAAYALDRFRFPGKLIVEQLISLPLVFPLVVLGIALLVMVSNLGLAIGMWQIVIGHVIITLPFVVRNCTAVLRGVSPSLEEAAWTLGAPWWRSFVEIILPLMRPGILAGTLIAFILSFNEFTISYFLYTVDVQPFPIWLYSQSNTSLDPTIFALASVVIILDVILILILDRIVGKQGLSL